MTAARLLVAVGDAEAAGTWSGIPHHLLAAGRRSGFLQGGLGLEPGRLRLDRAAWNAWRLLRSGRPGGYQYSPRFLRRLWAGGAAAAAGAELLSHFPLLPPPGAGGRVSFYIDATLRQNFDDYGLGERVHPELRDDALRREREQYARAERVVCMSRWAAASVVRDYGVPASKVFVVRAGANLDEAALSRLPPPPPPERDVLRLGFVGKDWRRKGLPFLLEVADAIAARRQAVEVIAVGPSAAELPPHPLLRPLGFLDKRGGLAHFVAAISSAHFGCLFSSAEALGISTLEFLRLGIPVAGFEVGGISDCITADVGLLLRAGTGAADVAGALLDAFAPGRYEAFRAAARAHATEVTWDRAVAELEAIWGAPR
ncbi:MAG TPA: glycosyltransferase family 4 protein [Anaeromyxobacteraceae bacterium]|nr:glycosyltransferase family 4 protein [Anaeromyxobacteraceae bacterium]